MFHDKKKRLNCRAGDWLNCVVAEEDYITSVVGEETSRRKLGYSQNRPSVIESSPTPLVALCPQTQAVEIVFAGRHTHTYFQHSTQYLQPRKAFAALKAIHNTTLKTLWYDGAHFLSRVNTSTSYCDGGGGWWWWWRWWW